MALLKLFSQLKSKFPDREPFPMDKVEKAFTVDGVDYYHFRDPADMSIRRWEAALDRQTEIENRVTNEYLKLHCKLTREALNKGELSEASYLNTTLEERLTHLSSLEFLYNLASVWYFDKNENIYDYSFEYAEAKIARWRTDKGTVDFFLSSPLRNYIHFPDGFTLSIRDYSRAVLTEEKARLHGVSSRLSKLSGSDVIRPLTSSRMENLQSWIDSIR